MRFVWLLVLLVACAHDVHARFPAPPPGAPTGRLVLLLSQPASGVSVAIGGQLVVEEEHTKKVVIDAIPVGNVDVDVAANGSDKRFRVWIDDTYTTTMPLGVPDASAGLWKTLLGTLITIAAYSLLR